MPVIQEGSVNTTALIVPDVYVQILSPSNSYLNGVPTDILGIVGTSSWGPVDVPVTIATMSDYDRLFGPVLQGGYDLGTAAAVAVLQGATNMRCVRVTDGTDLAASASVLDTESTPVEGISLAAVYTGSVGNSIKATVAAGSNSTVAVPTYKVTITRPHYVPEIFDNIGGTGLPLWQNMVDAINLGQTSVRSKSNLVVATIGTSTGTPNVVTYSMTGGADGITSVTKTEMIGLDVAPRTGMYALRSTKCSIALLHGLTDTDVWTSQVAFGLSEGIYMLLAAASGQYADLDAAILAKKTAGIDSYAAKLMLGDWIYFEDIVNSVTRLISQQAYIGGLMANSIPAQSVLNKQLYGVVGTEATANNIIYSEADIAKLVNAGIDVVTNPSPGGAYFSARIGHNTSSNASIWGDNYTRMTNYLAYTLNAGMGRSIGKLITELLWEQSASTINSFLQTLNDSTPPLIGDPSGAIPYSVKIDKDNNPDAIVAQGKMIAGVKVKYLSVLEVFLINLEGSQVTVVRTSTQPTN